MGNKGFYEKQKFNQPIIWLPLAGICIFITYSVIHRVMEQSASLEELWKLILPLLLITLFLLITLETKINDKGISYRFFPFFFSFTFIAWDELEHVTVRKYKPILEYGGWGYRLGIFGKGRAVSISGNRGIQLKLKNGKRLLIGTRHPETVMDVLIGLNRLSGTE